MECDVCKGVGAHVAHLEDGVHRQKNIGSQTENTDSVGAFNKDGADVNTAEIEFDTDFSKDLHDEEGVDKVEESTSTMDPLPMIRAAQNGDVECMKRFIQSGVDVNQVKHSTSALCAAVTCGNAICAELLIEAGADVNF